MSKMALCWNPILTLLLTLPGVCLAKNYDAGKGLVLTDTIFSIAPTYQLPQTCSASQVTRWNGTAWACATLSIPSLSTGSANETLRYSDGGTLVANNFLQSSADGGLLATGIGSGGIPASGPGIRLMWYPAKAAFRVGSAGVTEWDDVNVGSFSMALGAAVTASGYSSTAAGLHSTASGYAAVAMGGAALASGQYSLATGTLTRATGVASTAFGYGTVASGSVSTAMGASTATGSYSTAMGTDTLAGGDSSTSMGYFTRATGIGSTAMGYGTDADGDQSTAMGGGAHTNGMNGSYAYGDHTYDVWNDSPHQFMVLASGGVKFYSGVAGIVSTGDHDQSAWPGVALASGAGAWSTLSDRAAKDHFTRVDARDVLERVASLPLTTWHYKSQDDTIRHIGPIAQDFYAAFKVGEDEKHISTVDADGVALAAIQGLYQELKNKDTELAKLREKNGAQIAALRAQLSVQETRVSQLEVQSAEIASLKAAVVSLQQQREQVIVTTAWAVRP